jgi:hypothetical protein
MKKPRDRVIDDPIVAQIVHSTDLRRAIIAEVQNDGGTLTQQAISQWPRRKRGVPIDRVDVVSRVLGIPPHQIRPDVFRPLVPRRKASTQPQNKSSTAL